MKKIFILCLLLACLQGLSSEDLSTADILEKYEQNLKHSTSIVKAQINTTDSFGITKQTFEVYSRENGDTLIIIADGPDKGQKILRLENSLFLYYPSAEEVVRLTGSALKDSIAGTDFSYEDLSGDNSVSNNYTSVLKGIEEIEGEKYYVLELSAKKKTLTYQKQTLYINTVNFTTGKTIVYSAGGKALREIRSSDVKQVSGKFIAFTTTVTDLLKKNSKTEMIISSITLNEDIPPSYFDREGLTW